MVLIGYWSLNETSGTTSYDHSGNENHGTMKNGAGPSGTGTVTGPTGQTAYQFDGTDDWIDTGAGFLSNGEPRTYSIWVKPNSFGLQRFVGRQKETGVTDFTLTTNKSDQFELEIYNGSSYSTVTSTSKSTGIWYHVVGTHSSGDLNKLYINGKEVGRTTHATDTVSGNIPIGSANENSNNFHGSLSEARIYNHALTPSEVQYLYTVGKHGKLTTNQKTS